MQTGRRYEMIVGSCCSPPPGESRAFIFAIRNPQIWPSEQLKFFGDDIAGGDQAPISFYALRFCAPIPGQTHSQLLPLFPTRQTSALGLTYPRRIAFFGFSRRRAAKKRGSPGRASPVPGREFLNWALPWVPDPVGTLAQRWDAAKRHHDSIDVAGGRRPAAGGRRPAAGGRRIPMGSQWIH